MYNDYAWIVRTCKPPCVKHSYIVNHPLQFIQSYHGLRDVVKKADILPPSSPILGQNWKHDLARSCFILKKTPVFCTHQKNTRRADHRGRESTLTLNLTVKYPFFFISMTSQRSFHILHHHAIMPFLNPQIFSQRPRRNFKSWKSSPLLGSKMSSTRLVQRAVALQQLDHEHGQGGHLKKVK